MKFDKRYDHLQSDLAFDTTSEEEIFNAMLSQSESVERRGMILTQKMNTYAGQNASICINPICSDIVTPIHNHDFYEMNFVYEGELVQCIDRKKYVLKAGDLIFLSPTVSHVCYPVKGTTAVNVLIRPEFLEKCLRSIDTINSNSYLKYLMKNQVFQIFHSDEKGTIERFVRETAEYEKQEYQPYSKLLKENSLMCLLGLLSFHDRTDYTKQNTEVYQDYDKLIDAIMQYLTDNYATTSLSEAAARFGYSTRQLERIVYKKTGYNYSNFINYQRVCAARQLLATTDLPIKQISEILGYKNTEQFSRRFKFNMVCTPSEYRKQSQKRPLKKQPEAFAD